MRAGLAYGFLPYIYTGPKSTGARICNLIQKKIAESDFVSSKMNDYLRFRPYIGSTYDRHTMKKGASYERHELVLRIASVLVRVISYSGYQALKEEQKVAFAEKYADALVEIIVAPLEAKGLYGTHFLCEIEESGKPGEGYSRITTVKLRFDLPTEDQIFEAFQKA